MCITTANCQLKEINIYVSKTKLKSKVLMYLLTQILLQFCTGAVLLPTATIGGRIVTHLVHMPGHMPGYFGCSLNNYTSSCTFLSST